MRFNNVHAAIKLQFRDVDNFIHKDFRDREDIRYIKKTLDTQMSQGRAARSWSRRSATPAASRWRRRSTRRRSTCASSSASTIIKIASSDINDWFLIEKIAKTRKPVIVSTGGSSLKDIDDLVTFFERRNIPLAINHCVSIYPSRGRRARAEPDRLPRDRYPDHVIGYSTHEYTDWTSSVMMAYAKGARTFERHIDIEADGIPVSPYCTLPEQADEWFKAFQKAREMCGGAGDASARAAATRRSSTSTRWSAASTPSATWPRAPS